jgi:citrate lyase beta subunit
MRTLALAAMLLAACAAQFKESRTVCPEYRDLRCATAPECSMDQGRGCLVCQCSKPGIDLGPIPQPPR